MKKMIIACVFMMSLLFSGLSSSYVFAEETTDCANYNSTGTIGENLTGCLKGSQLVSGEDVTIEVGLKKKVNTWIGAISIFLGLFAVGAIVFGALRLTLSGGDDGKVEKGKQIIKWACIGFIALISASGLIKLTISVMYGISDVVVK